MDDAPTPQDDHTRQDGGSPANLFTHGRTGASLRSVPASRDEAADAGHDEQPEESR